MKIVLYVNSFLPDAIGGREIVVHYLADAMRRMGHKVRVLGPAGWRSRNKSSFSYPVHRWPTLGGRLEFQVNTIRLLMDIMLFGCDIIHAHNTTPTGYVAAKLKKFFRYPLVITPHGADIHMIPEINHGLRLDPKKDAQVRYAVKHADALTAISDSVRTSLLEVGAPPERIYSIPNGIDINRFTKSISMDIYHRLGIEKNARIILNVGNYHPRKGQDILIRSMPEILRHEPNARLVIVGRGTEILKPLVTELGIEKQVCLPGLIKYKFSLPNEGSNEDSTDWLAGIYQQASVYVSAGVNQGSEGLSLALLDAMAAGVPLIGTAISGNTDIIKNGVTGRLVPPGDSGSLAKAIPALFNSPELSKEISRNVQNEAQKYSWDAIAQQYCRLYKEIIGVINSDSVYSNK